MIGRLRGQTGFGLIELLMAMVMLNIGLLAVVAAFTSGIWGIARAGSVSTAAALADQQMEVYRGLTYSYDAGTGNGQLCLYLVAPPAVGTYASDSAYSATQRIDTSHCQAGNTPPAKATTPSQASVVGPDRHKYEVDSYIICVKPDGTPPCVAGTRQLTQVTVVVRDALKVTKVLARQTSLFDPSSGG